MCPIFWFLFPGLHFTDRDANGNVRHVLPVIVFDITEGGEYGILIDGTVKATAFSDMVVAVSSRANTVQSHMTCG